MTIVVPCGQHTLILEHLILDVNGTLAEAGKLLPGVADRIERLRDQIQVLLVSADTYNTLDEIATTLRLPMRIVSADL